MLDSGAALLAILIGFGTIGGGLWKFARWGWRQDRAIFDLEKKNARLEREVEKLKSEWYELKWAGKVVVFRHRRRIQDTPILPAPYDDEEQEDEDES